MSGEAPVTAAEPVAPPPAPSPADLSGILTCNLELADPDETPRVNSPCNVIFRVRNNTTDDIGLHLGGDDRNRTGRPDSFACTVERDHSGTFLPILDCGANFGGIISPSRIPPGEST